MSKSDLPAAAAQMLGLFEEAITVHVYGDETPPADCQLVASAERVRAALGLPPSAIVRAAAVPVQDGAAPALPRVVKLEDLGSDAQSDVSRAVALGADAVRYTTMGVEYLRDGVALPSDTAALPSAGDLPPPGIEPAPPPPGYEPDGKYAVWPTPALPRGIRAPSPAAMRARCDAFNRVCPVGGAVKVRLDNGTTIDTVTVSEAQVLSGHTPVIWLRDVRGCYALDRVTPQDVI